MTYSLLTKDGFEVQIKADRGVTFDGGPKGKGSLLKSGVMIIENASTRGRLGSFARSW